MITTTLTALSLFAVPPAVPPTVRAPAVRTPGETLPKGPPWHVTYRAAKRDALRNGRPVYVYFTKTY